MYNINIVLISPINQLKIIRYYFKVVIRISDMSIPILSRFYELYLYYSDIICISFISIYESAYTILISSAYCLYLFMNRYILFWYRPQTVNSDYILILKSIYNRAYTILILSAYHLYLFKNQHSDSFGKKEYLIFVNSRHKIAAESPRIGHK